MMQCKFETNISFGNQTFLRGQTYNLPDKTAIALGFKKAPLAPSTPPTPPATPTPASKTKKGGKDENKGSEPVDETQEGDKDENKDNEAPPEETSGEAPLTPPTPPAATNGQ
jgi:hypothetical protein